MGFPSSSVMQGWMDVQHAERIADIIINQRPELADVVVADQAKSMVRIGLRDGRSVVVAKITEGHLIRWGVVAPGKDKAVYSLGLDQLAATAVEEFDRLNVADVGDTGNAG